MPDPSKCLHHEALQQSVDRIEKTVIRIDGRLSDGDKAMARYGIVEKIVFGVVAVTLVGVAGAVIRLVVIG